MTTYENEGKIDDRGADPNKLEFWLQSKFFGNDYMGVTHNYYINCIFSFSCLSFIKFIK